MICDTYRLPLILWVCNIFILVLIAVVMVVYIAFLTFRSILHGVEPLSYFSFQPVLHDWCNKGCGMCYPVSGMVQLKEPLWLLIGKSSLCGGSRFPLSLSEWSFTICSMPYNCELNVLSASLNKTFPSFLTFLSECKKGIRKEWRDGYTHYTRLNEH